jgi:RNA polymerase sigma-70 factor (ECF subfamily)
MAHDPPNDRLSRIATLWSLVLQAHGGPADEAGVARARLLERYAGALHRYLLGALRDSDSADELFQEFALRFFRGDFKNADPGRGRFRDYLKAAAYRLVADHHNRRNRQPLPLSPDVAEPAAPPPSEADQDREFLDGWRAELLDRTWQALWELEKATGQPHHSVLRTRADHPMLSSEELAERVGARLGKTLSVAAVRQALHRAREKFADLLVAEAARSLEGATPDRLEAELIDLGLHGSCREALARHRSG